MSEEVKWTKEQKQAIEEKGENILVAAAAGSGKTAVLVERIIQKVIHEEVSIDKILVVTFTNAAASEMRQRILEAIYQKIEEDPTNVKLQRQITLLNQASICTIHAFCLDMIRNYFYEINTSANFRVGDTTEIELLKQEVLEEVFEQKYEQEEQEFIELVKLYTKYRDDIALKELVLQIYNFIQSMPFPEDWLKEKIEALHIKEEQDFTKTCWGKVIMQEVQENIQESILVLQHVKKTMQLYLPEMEKFYITICRDVENLEKLKQLCTQGTWDEITQAFNNLSLDRWPTDKKCENAYKTEAKEIRDTVSKKVKEYTSQYFSQTNQEIARDSNHMYRIIKNLGNLVIEFTNQFAKAKKERNIVDFNDIEHFALHICVQKKEGNILPTAVAQKLQEKYEEILIDEYQDSNEVQENILKSISRGNNIFMVGDVKQSIYQFRQAKPQLFLQKYATYTKQKQEGKGLKIQLFKNFRSRKEVLQITNVIFENIMQKEIGGIEYNQEEYLNLGASYPEKQEKEQLLQPELHIIDLAKQDGDEEIEEVIDNNTIEAQFVASKIQELLQSHYAIYDAKKKTYRNIEPKDIVILLRSTTALAPLYEKELEKQAIPVFSDTSGEYLDTPEIQTIISLLKILDNPMQDIPLVTVLKSAIANFTDNELVEIRLVDKKESFYITLLKARNSVRKDLANKIESFLQNLAMWKEQIEYKTLDELIWQIYVDTNYYNYVGLLPNGALKQANLKLLFEKAKQYEQASFKGLFQFINFIDKLKSSSGDMQSAKILGENENVVRIMSIHKSKGLEFPVVFLCATHKKFNMQDMNQKILLHETLGITPNFIGTTLPIEYPIIPKQAVKLQLKTETIAEEMRVLYVALTRAKEKLYITGIVKDLQKSWKEKQQIMQMQTNEKIPVNIIKKYPSYLDWIQLVYCKNKECIRLQEHKKQEIEQNTKKEEQKENIQEKLNQYVGNQQVQNTLKQELNYVYPYEKATTLPMQLAVTDIEKIGKQNISHTQVELAVPQFMRETAKLTHAQKGSLIHLCIQKLEEHKQYNLLKIEEFLQNLVEKQIILDNEVKQINPKILLQYTQSPLWQKLQTAQEIHKEEGFYMSKKASQIYPDMQESKDEIILQGIIDLYYRNAEGKIILVDYKTDYVEQGKEQELIEKYKSQLWIYQEALERALEEKVEKIIIYSVYLQKEIEIVRRNFSSEN